VIETVGRYNAQVEPSEIVLKEDRIRHWIARGAQPSNSVVQLMRTQGLSRIGVRGATQAAAEVNQAVDGEVAAEATGLDGAEDALVDAGTEGAAGEATDAAASGSADAPADGAPDAPADGDNAPAA